MTPRSHDIAAVPALAAQGAARTVDASRHLYDCECALQTPAKHVTTPGSDRPA